MSYQNISYTQDGWTVNEKAIPTVTSGFPDGFKNYPIANFNWSADFSLANESVSANGREKSRTYEFTNSDGGLLDQPFVVQFGVKHVDNVYNSLNKDLSIDGKMLQKSGKQVLVKLEEAYKATNTDSVETLPVKAWLCMTMPTGTPVSKSIVTRSLQKLLGACFKEGSNGDTLLIDMMRGDIDVLN